MKILVTGTTGFIGNRLITRLQKEKHLVYAIVRPSSNMANLKRRGVKTYVYRDNIVDLISFLKRGKFDGIIHLASLFLAQHQSTDVQGLVNSNVLFSTILLEAATQAKIPWFINTGTYAQHYQNKSYSPINLYAATKQAFADISKYYVESSLINFATIELSDTFGPGDTRPKIFNIWLNYIKTPTKEALKMSPGHQIIDISYIGNVIDGYMQLMKLLSTDKKKTLAGKTFSLRSAERMSLRKLARVFLETAKVNLQIEWGGRPYRPRDSMVPWNKGKLIPGWKPKVSLRKGIRTILHG